LKTGSEVSRAAHDAVARVLGTLSRPYRWPSDEAKGWIVNFVMRACAIERTRALVMIGSIVRPIATVNDVDLLYIYDEEPLSFRHHPLDVDIRAFSVLDVLKRFEQQQDLIIWSLEFGHLLYERDAFWSELRRRFKERPLLPSPQTALDRTKRAERRLTELEGQGDTDAAAEQLVSTLTHRSWFQLLSAGVLPGSRAELSSQLRDVGQYNLAAELERAIQAWCFGQESRSSIKLEDSGEPTK
jgi:hypothetical protein